MTTPVASNDVVAPPALKPGVLTTEFWVTVITAFFGLLAGLGVIGPNWAHLHEPVVQALALLASVLVPGLYAISRGIAKGGHQIALGNVLGTAISHGQLRVTPSSTTTGGVAPSDAGVVDIGWIIALVGALVAAIGGIWLIVGAVHHNLDVTGLVLLVVGVIILFFAGGSTYRGTRRL